MDLRSFRQRIVPLLALLIVLGPAWAAAAEYLSEASMSKRLSALAQREPDLIHLHDLATSRAGRTVRLVEVGAGTTEDRAVRPAMLVVAGIEGTDLVGPVTAVAWIERLMEQDQADARIATLLKTTTLYVIPCLNPDATEHFFATPKQETTINGTPYDDDHDGLTDEDGCEDLNADGFITMMRVEDKEGRFILDPNEPRLLLEADPVKGESGSWRLLPEGIDSDGDKRWNEDGPGGVSFNRNFPYNYKYLTSDVGPHPISEAETQALADFVVAHPHIGIVLTYGAADNLRETPEAGASPGRSKPMEAIDEEDVGYYSELGTLYREALGLDDELECGSEPGTFSDWMYFHRGRLSVAVRPWDASLARALAQAEESQDNASQEGKADDPNDPNATEADEGPSKDEDERGKDEREQLAWFDEHAPDAFVQWQAIDHPDFPGQRVELGGYRPFARTNPPVEMLADLATKHGAFLTELAQRLARIKVRRVACRLLTDAVYEIEIHVANTGFLPTALAHGRTTREVYPTRVILELEPEHFLSGARTTFVPTIAGSGGTVKARYVIHAADRRAVRFEVVSMLAGRVDGTVELLRTSDAGADRSGQVEDNDHGVDSKE